MKKIISTEYTRYAGDSDYILYLDRGITGNVQLCLQADWGSAGVLHLTSTDDDYQAWLYKHCSSLLLIGKEQWYSAVDKGNRTDFHQEFHYILKNLQKVTGYIEHPLR